MSGSGPGHTQQMEASPAATNQNPGSLVNVELNSTLALKAHLQCLQVDKFICMMYLSVIMQLGTSSDVLHCRENPLTKRMQFLNL